jgi:hypothetical protein
MSEKIEIKHLTPNRSFILLSMVICGLILNFQLCLGEVTTPYTELSSQACSQSFYDMAYQIATSEKANESSARQAVVFFKAAGELGSSNSNVQPELIRLISRYSPKDNFSFVQKLLEEHLNQQADYGIINDAVSYLLNTTNTREKREELIIQLLKSLKGKNNYLDSELITSLGLLRSELSDPNAVGIFLQAYQTNRYNRLAFAKLLELVPQYVNTEANLEHLRLILRENLLDLQAALSFAEFARQAELYQLSVDAYQFCASLFYYLYPSEQLPAYIYLPWTISAYNSPRSQYKCIEIAKELELKGRFDLAAQTIAAKAAQKMGDSERATQISEQAVKKAKQNYYTQTLADGNSKIEICQSLAWFYCFAWPDANESLEWAGEAYALEPNSPTTASLLSYALYMNKQPVKAREIAEKYQTNQIANLTMAQIQMSEDHNNIGAINTLGTAIQKDAGSLEAETARQILTQLSVRYQPALVEETAVEKLKNRLKGPVVPTFMSPAKILSAQLNLRGTKFDYGKDFGATLSIKNNSTDPMIISDNGLFRGNIRVDAYIKGDINKKIPKLITMKVQPTTPIGPGKSILIPLNLMTGQLREILLNHPQASLGIEFIVFLDPVTTENKNVGNRLADVTPLAYRVTRPPVKITTRYLKTQMDSLSTAPEIKTVQLFAGLLKEQKELARGEFNYNYVSADWLPNTLLSAVIYCLKNDNWETRVQTMGAISELPLDSKLLSNVADNLNYSHWPVRLMALYLLAKNGYNLEKVLDWTARYDSNQYVREMAVACGAKEPEEKEVTREAAIPGPSEAETQKTPAAVDSNNIPAAVTTDSNNISAGTTTDINNPGEK